MKRNFQLMPHQEEAVQWLERRGGIGLIYGDPGVGKTFIATEYSIREDFKNVLVICPATLKRQWRDEIRAYCGELAVIVDGSADERAFGWRSGYRFKITNYEKVVMDLDSINETDWDLVIADESHMVNSPTADRTKAFKRIGTKRRVALSGDPFPNALYEVFSIIDWFAPGFLGQSWSAFRRTWCYTNPKVPSQIVAVENPDELKRQILHFIHRIHKEEAIADLKPKNTRYEWVDMDPEEAFLYKMIEEEYRLIFEGEEKLTVTTLMSMLMRLRQVVDDPHALEVQIQGAKYLKLKEILSVPAEGKTIVFSEFSTLAHRLAKEYGGALISGKLTTGEREVQIDRFKKDSRCDILFSTPAGGYGLNLTVASRVIHFGVPWNWSRVNQRVSRSWRKGQEREVEEIYLLARKTVDVKMLKLVEKKKELAAGFDKKRILEELLQEPV